MGKIRQLLNMAPHEIEKELDQALARSEWLRQSTLKRTFERKLA
jgi:hypothetical protein